MSRLTQEKLTELKAVIPHCAAGDELSTEYVAPFAEPIPGGKCLSCGREATFTWGLAHGEGHCYECGWPARLYHFIKAENGTERRVVRLLQYHPDGISIKKPKP